MEQEIVTIPEYKVAGIEIHTSNEKAMEEIGAVWGRFFKEGIQGKISNKGDKNVITMKQKK